MIPAGAVEAAARAYIDLWSVEVITSPQEYAEAMLEAAAPHMLAEAWTEGHESGFWTGMKAHPLSEIVAFRHCNEIAKATNPYKAGTP